LPLARLGILFDQSTAVSRWRYGINTYQKYLGEILSHAGMTYEWLLNSRDIATSQCDIIIAAVADEGKDTCSALLDYARAGGILISYAELHSLADSLGFRRDNSVEVGYAKCPATDKLNSGCIQLRFLHAIPWFNKNKPVTGINEKGTIHYLHSHLNPVGTLLHQVEYGCGRIDRWSVDIPQTIVRMQQGIHPVLEDGVPAPDDSGNVNEGILKADDAIAFDWVQDRIHTETGNPLFPFPQADLWREQLLSHLIGAALERGLTLPFLGYWPEGISNVAMISHDSDGNEDEHALTTLELLDETKVHSSWCMLEPGYSYPVYEKVKAAGHELAFHFNALEEDGGAWTEDEFARQFQWLKCAADLSSVVSNKNHYTRFEGWGGLFEWCEKNGLQSDQTRGPSKLGNAGFLFGTCHPYFPMAWFNEKNRLYNVLEISFLTQDMDLGKWADSSIIIPCLEQVERVGGIAHFLFHQVHIHNKAAVRDSFRELVKVARSRGFVFWTGDKVNEWHRARRLTRVVGLTDQGNVEVEHAPEGIIVWIPVADDTASESSVAVEWHLGHKCRKQLNDRLPKLSKEDERLG
jgi:hypothetical protein